MKKQNKIVLATFVTVLALSACCALCACGSSSSATSSDAAAQTTDLAVGQTAKVDDGLEVTVNSITTVTNSSDEQLVAAQVTYTNNGSSGADYNMLDWKGETSTGAQESCTIYFSLNNDAPGDSLDSGSLAAGGTVSGWLYFKPGTVKALYFGSMLDNDPSASWNLQ